MVSSHTAVAIAQTVFYAPAVPVTFYSMVKNWRLGPRLAWYPLFAFALRMNPRFYSLESTDTGISTARWWYNCDCTRVPAYESWPQRCCHRVTQRGPYSPDSGHYILGTVGVSHSSSRHQS
jgi:hypothetical protein